ncbi:transglutaminase domain-containing protein [Acidobacteriota bacterium]
MKFFFLLLLFIIPLREVESIKLSFPAQVQRHDIFLNYDNDNFSQKFYMNENRLTADIKSINFVHLNLNFRIFLDKKRLAKLDPETKEIVLNLFDNSITLDHYFKKISPFLEKNIKYTEERLPQDEISVLINRKANCIGFSNLAGFFLDCAGVKNRFVKGFYLMKEKGRVLVPIPHKWIEIQLSRGVHFFYDPQRQKFSANYIVTRDDVDFKKIRKFKALLIKKSKKVLN